MQAELKWWKKASAKQILGEQGAELDELFYESQWKYRQLIGLAESERESRVKWLEGQLRLDQPAQLSLKKRSEEVWRSLWHARTAQGVRAACKEWQSLLDSPSRYPSHILEFEAEFRQMKRDARFPRSGYADDSRIDYLSRGIAGLMVHPSRSPITVIQRLRTMKHTEGGPLWNGALNHCECWRHSLARLDGSLEKGLREGKSLFQRLGEFPEGEL